MASMVTRSTGSTRDSSPRRIGSELSSSSQRSIDSKPAAWSSACKRVEVPGIAAVVLVLDEDPSEDVDEVLDPSARAPVCVELGAGEVASLEVHLGALLHVGRDQPQPPARGHH